MKIDSKIIQEIERYKKINNYITEQDAPPPAPPAPAPDAAAAPLPVDAAGVPAAPVAPAPPAGGEPQKVDLETDKEVEKIDDKPKKELEITDLVKSQKNIEDKQEQYFENLFNQLQGLEQKLSDLNQVMQKLNSLESKIEKYRTKSPEEKMELRTLDSGPYNQKLTDFFQDKQSDFEKTGKEQYILTKDEVEDFSPNEIRKTFRNFGSPDEFMNI
jgi:flagellar motility protein MotE (MotC chaperone)